MSREIRGALPGAEHTLFGGYGPLVALVALVLAMALLAPTIAPERDVTTGPRPLPENLRSSVTTGVAQERRSAATAAGAENLRSSVTTGVAQERRFESGAGGDWGGR